MRTTIELTEQQHEALNALAKRRGIRGFSPLVQEAIDAYLGHLASEEIDLLLDLEGSVSEEEAKVLSSRIAEARRHGGVPNSRNLHQAQHAVGYPQ